jgi:hypothetical protein
MKKYALIFSAAYVVAAILVGIVGELFRLRSSGSIGIAAILAASMFASHQFTNDHQREPTPAEKKSYAWQALLGFWIVSLTVFGIALAYFGGTEASKMLLELLAEGWFLLAMTVGVLLVSLICYVAIRWPFAWYAKNSRKSINAGS